MKPAFLSLLLTAVCSLGLVTGCSAEPKAAASPETAANQQLGDDNLLRLLPVGARQARAITPDLLELTLVTRKEPGLPLKEWNFVDASGAPRLPSPTQFAVTVGTNSIAVVEVGFKRHAYYAPLKQRDLRVMNWLYLRLRSPIPQGAAVQVRNPDKKLWAEPAVLTLTMDPLRWSPAIHVNQTGYMPGQTKWAMVGYYLGSLGELQLSPVNVTNSPSASNSFVILDSRSRPVFQGTLVLRPDAGWDRQQYQNVFLADFSPLNTPGEYRLQVPGLGVSLPFRIDLGTAAAFARTYALGIYHQRCGCANELPFTRFTHKPCHTAPAEVPDMSKKFESVNESLKKETANWKENPRHTAPPMKSVAACLYPFVNRGPVDVRGGHHDAGDYSKYTINSAGFIHHLVFAADVFPGVADLDNLGLPESGDGLSDILQEAKWEADFLAKMQDADGGFYFLVYPRDREYEGDVLPDQGDPQVVFPKTTAVTAAATAALAQIASSSKFKQQFPRESALYLEKARKGWDFLERAIKKFGPDGSYQKFTHYGDEFIHDDELAWAAVELFLATGETRFHEQVLRRLHPADPENRKWGWWRLFDAWGSAIRSYAFADASGRRKSAELNMPLQRECQDEIAAAGEDQLRRARESAYGTCFPDETKRARSAGWYFFADAAFDLATACQLKYPELNDPRPAMMDALISSLNYEQGCNPVNVVYLTGLGWIRQREIVHQYAQNDRRTLPPSGIPLGNIQAGLAWLDLYKSEPADLSFPSDSADSNFYPFYDRWSDSFNLTQEFVILHQARGLGALAWLMARSPLKTQPWKSAPGTIVKAPAPSNFELRTPNLDLSLARIVWEAPGIDPVITNSLSLPSNSKPSWVEAEAQFEDGRRVFGIFPR